MKFSTVFTAPAQKTLLLTASVLLIVGCGKSKETKSAAVPASAAEQSAPQTLLAPDQAASSTLTLNDQSLIPSAPESDLNNQGQVLPPLPAAPTGSPQFMPSQNDGSSPFVPVSSQSSSFSQAETQLGDSSVIKPPLALSKQPVLSTNTVQFNEAEAVKTGGQLNKLYYTSFSQDGLMAEFKSYNSKVNADQKTMNLNLAKALVSAKLVRSTSNGDIVLEIIADEFGQMKTYKMKATEEGDRYTLSSLSSQGDLEFEGGFLKCTDLDGGCENSYAKIKFSGAYARLVFRSSYADRLFLVQEKVSNPSFDLVNNYVMNTVNGVDTLQKIDFAQVASFEVVNGRAGAGLMLVTKDQDLLGLSIPLLAPEKGTALTAQVAKLSDLSKNYNLSPLSGTYSQKISQAIKNVQLVNNNGRGQLKLKLDLSEGSSTASMWLVVSKVNKATMSVEQVRQFESKIKAF